MTEITEGNGDGKSRTHDVAADDGMLRIKNQCRERRPDKIAAEGCDPVDEAGDEPGNAEINHRKDVHAAPVIARSFVGTASGG